MYSFLSIFIMLILLGGRLDAQMYKFKYKFELKKNQTQEIVVKYASFKHLLRLRWTLFKGHRIVLFMTYRKKSNQYLLRDDDYNQNSIKLDLSNVAVGYNVLPYIILQFKKFNEMTHKAIFFFYLFDKTDMVRLKFVK